MSKENFKDFIIEDLTWWINITDYPTEIKDNQSVECSNWNFDWSKLISDKWIEEVEDLWELVQWMTLNNKELWTLADDILYKDWVEITSKSWARLWVKWLTYYYRNDIKDPNWTTITKTNETQAYFPEWIDYTITVNWVDYLVTWASKDDLYQNLKTQLELDWFTCIISGWYIYITSDSAITVVIPNYTQKVIFLQDIITNSSPWIEEKRVKWFFFIINNIRHFWYTTLRLWELWNNVTKFDEFIRNNFYNKLVSLLPWYTFKKTTLNKDDEWHLIVAWDIAWAYSAIILPINMDFQSSMNWLPSQEQVLLIQLSSYDDAYVANPNITLTKWWVTVNLNLQSQWLDTMTKFIDWLKLNWYWKTFQADGAYYISPSDTYPYYCIVIQWDNYEPVTVGWYYNINYWYFLNAPYSILNYKAFTISDNSFDYKALNNSVSWLWIVDITIGNMGNLIVDKKWWWAFYYWEDLISELDEASVWEPTCGTIYNWKIILWGYPNNDNIVFSQTSSPREPFNLLNFTDYSAWGQSISGWDRWEVRGFSVWENGLYVFKDNSVWYSNTEKDSSSAWAFNFIFNKITSNWALSQRVITNVQQDIFYLDWENKAIRRLSYEQNMNTLRDNSISDDIRWLISSLPEEQPLATASFHYPNYILSLTDWTSSEVTYPDWNIYHLNNKHFIYNVDKKSWATKTWINDLIVSDKWYLALNDWKVYKVDVWNTLEDWTFISKKYVITNDSRYKRLWHVDIVWRITPDNLETKTITVKVIVDWVVVETRNISSTTNVYDFTERIDMYNDWQYVQFEITHSWEWKAELIDIYISYKPINWYNKNYF